jgi:predicted ArsR family transcriptional regulator
LTVNNQLRRSRSRQTRSILILTINQLPDSRRAILTALKQNGSATIAQLAAILQLTGEAVRQQLLQLQRDGWIEARVERATGGRTGRPATGYSLTPAGDHLFPKQYDALNVAMIDAISDELGPDAAKRVLARVAEDKANVIEPMLRELTVEQRIEALRNWYLQDDPYMETEKTPDGFRLIERNCPFYNTAMRRPNLCSVSVNALTRVLGVRVYREEKFQDGDGRCIFRVMANEPVDTENFNFALESE